MQWPDRPTCHAVAPVHVTVAIEWHPPNPDAEYPQTGRPFRTCSYCGSMHPEDLIAALRQGARLEGADWKYGWPHKFYVARIPNPREGQQIVTGEISEPGPDGVRVSTPVYGIARPIHHKWYNAHLGDEGYDDEAMALLLGTLTRFSGITWRRDEQGRIHWQAPRYDYQR
jgi:hypothetical protein